MAKIGARPRPFKLKCSTGNFQCGSSCQPVSYISTAKASYGKKKWTNCGRNAEGMPKTGLEFLQRRVDAVNARRAEKGNRAPLQFDPEAGKLSYPKPSAAQADQSPKQAPTQTKATETPAPTSAQMIKHAASGGWIEATSAKGDPFHFTYHPREKGNPLSGMFEIRTGDGVFQFRKMRKIDFENYTDGIADPSIQGDAKPKLLPSGAEYSREKPERAPSAPAKPYTPAPVEKAPTLAPNGTKLTQKQDTPETITREYEKLLSAPGSTREERESALVEALKGGYSFDSQRERYNEYADAINSNSVPKGYGDYFSKQVAKYRPFIESEAFIDRRRKAIENGNYATPLEAKLYLYGKVKHNQEYDYYDSAEYANEYEKLKPFLGDALMPPLSGNIFKGNIKKSINQGDELLITEEVYGLGSNKSSGSRIGDGGEVIKVGPKNVKVKYEYSNWGTSTTREATVPLANVTHVIKAGKRYRVTDTEQQETPAPTKTPSAAQETPAPTQTSAVKGKKTKAPKPATEYAPLSQETLAALSEGSAVFFRPQKNSTALRGAKVVSINRAKGTARLEYDTLDGKRRNTDRPLGDLMRPVGAGPAPVQIPSPPQPKPEPVATKPQAGAKPETGAVKAEPKPEPAPEVKEQDGADPDEFRYQRRGEDVTATIGKARYRKGDYSIVRTRGNSDSDMKTEFDWLLENLGGQYSGRERGYILSPSATQRFRKLAPLAGLESYQRTQEQEFMFRAEYFNEGRVSFKNKSDRRVIHNAKFHRLSVESALEDGKSVAPEVLKDYPDLAAKFPSAAQPADSKPGAAQPAKTEKPAPVEDPWDGPSPAPTKPAQSKTPAPKAQPALAPAKEPAPKAQPAPKEPVLSPKVESKPSETPAPEDKLQKRKAALEKRYDTILDEMQSLRMQAQEQEMPLRVYVKNDKLNGVKEGDFVWIPNGNSYEKMSVVKINTRTPKGSKFNEGLIELRSDNGLSTTRNNGDFVVIGDEKRLKEIGAKKAQADELREELYIVELAINNPNEVFRYQPNKFNPPQPAPEGEITENSFDNGPIKVGTAIIDGVPKSIVLAQSDTKRGQTKIDLVLHDKDGSRTRWGDYTYTTKEPFNPLRLKGEIGRRLMDVEIAPDSAPIVKQGVEEARRREEEEENKRLEEANAATEKARELEARSAAWGKIKADAVAALPKPKKNQSITYTIVDSEGKAKDVESVADLYGDNYAIVKLPGKQSYATLGKTADNYGAYAWGVNSKTAKEVLGLIWREQGDKITVKGDKQRTPKLQAIIDDIKATGYGSARKVLDAPPEPYGVTPPFEDEILANLESQKSDGAAMQGNLFGGLDAIPVDTEKEAKLADTAEKESQAKMKALENFRPFVRPKTQAAALKDATDSQLAERIKESNELMASVNEQIKPGKEAISRRFNPDNTLGVTAKEAKVLMDSLFTEISSRFVGFTKPPDEPRIDGPYDEKAQLRAIRSELKKKLPAPIKVQDVTPEGSNTGVTQTLTIYPKDVGIWKNGLGKFDVIYDVNDRANRQNHIRDIKTKQEAEVLASVLINEKLTPDYFQNYAQNPNGTLLKIYGDKTLTVSGAGKQYKVEGTERGIRKFMDDLGIINAPRWESLSTIHNDFIDAYNKKYQEIPFTPPEWATKAIGTTDSGKPGGMGLTPTVKSFFAEQLLKLGAAKFPNRDQYRKGAAIGEITLRTPDGAGEYTLPRTKEAIDAFMKGMGLNAKEEETPIQALRRHAKKTLDLSEDPQLSLPLTFAEERLVRSAVAMAKRAHIPTLSPASRRLLAQYQQRTGAGV